MYVARNGKPNTKEQTSESKTSAHNNIVMVHININYVEHNSIHATPKEEQNQFTSAIEHKNKAWNAAKEWSDKEDNLLIAHRIKDSPPEFSFKY